MNTPGIVPNTVLSTTAKPLPSVEDFPDAPVVLYDGHCKFCQRQVRRIADRDGRGRLAFLSLHDPQVARRWSDLTHEQLMREMVIVTPEGRKFAGASALRYVSRHLPRLWWIMPILHIPGSLPLWKWLYAKVALQRYMLGAGGSCDDGQCKIGSGNTNGNERM